MIVINISVGWVGSGWFVSSTVLSGVASGWRKNWRRQIQITLPARARATYMENMNLHVVMEQNICACCVRRYHE